MELTDENRDIVWAGLKILNNPKTLRLPIKYLLGDNAKTITAQTISYSIAPRINAGGRMGDAKCALQLLTETNPNKAFDTSEIRRSLRDNFVELMKDEFNPYGDTAEEDSVKIYVPKSKDVKLKKEKKAKRNRKAIKEDISVSETPVISEEVPVEEKNSKTYMDDFSDMLSDLEQYKNKNDGGNGK
jgi:single-stranded DNA-specific DHH superfamily exonuclease